MIQQGEPLTFNYLGENALRSTPARRSLLQLTKRFVCQCGLCSAPDRMRALPCAAPACRSSMVFHPGAALWRCDSDVQTVSSTADNAQRDVSLSCAMDSSPSPRHCFSNHEIQSALRQEERAEACLQKCLVAEAMQTSGSHHTLIKKWLL